MGLSHEIMKSRVVMDPALLSAESRTATCPSRANGFTSAQKEETSTSSTWSPSLSQATSSCGTKPSNCESVFHNCLSCVFSSFAFWHLHIFFVHLCELTTYQETLKCKGMCLQIQRVLHAERTEALISVRAARRW